jgi:hypothetical protein
MLLPCDHLQQNQLLKLTESYMHYQNHAKGKTGCQIPHTLARG